MEGRRAQALSMLSCSGDDHAMYRAQGAYQAANEFLDLVEEAQRLRDKAPQ